MDTPNSSQSLSQTSTLSFTKSPLFSIAPFFFLGTSMVVMKAVIPNTSPLFLAGFRLVPAGIIILVLALAFKLPQPKTWRAWLWILVFAIVDGLMFQGFLTEGLVSTGAGLGAVLIDIQPLVVAVLSRLLFGEFIGVWGWLGLAIGVIGISLCGLPERWIENILQGDFTIFQNSFQDVFRGEASLGWGSLMHSGELLMLLAGLSMSFGTIIIRYVRQHTDAIVATGWHMVLGGIPLFILSFLFETQQWSNLDGIGWAGLGYATLFGTALTYGIFFYLASVGNLTSVSALIFLTPIFAMLFGYIFLGEMLTSFQWIGVALTLLSVTMVIQREAIAKSLPTLLTKFNPKLQTSVIPTLENTTKPPSN
jgi:drug/metabolite transporter (DMT)-like permease